MEWKIIIIYLGLIKILLGKDGAVEVAAKKTENRIVAENELLQTKEMNENMEAIAIVEYRVGTQTQYLMYSSEMGRAEKITPENLKEAIQTGKIKSKLSTGVLERFKKENGLMEDGKKTIEK